MLVHKRDLRVKKTERLVFDTMLSLMSRQRFGKIAVNELCESAEISRATFYAHFDDKYDLLKKWLISITTELCDKAMDIPFNERAGYINEIIYANRKVIENIVLEEDSETIEIVSEVILYLSDLSAGKAEEPYPEHVILSNFYAGGIVRYLKWQVKNRFPQEVTVLNEHLYKIIEKLLK